MQRLAGTIAEVKINTNDINNMIYERRSIAACAIITDQRNEITVWLVQWNKKWKNYHLIGGHKRPEESFRECLIREINEELGLQENDNSFLVAQEPVAHVEYTAWSASSQIQTLYTTELYHVQLISEIARNQVNSNPCNRWTTEAEIHRLRCVDGQPISEATSLLLSRAGQISEFHDAPSE